MENKNNLSNKQKAVSIVKWTMQKNKSFFIAYCVLLALAFPLVEVFMMLVANNQENYENYEILISVVIDYLPTTGFALIAVVYSTVISIMVFSYMHNKRSMDLFGSLPVSKRTLFFGRYCAAVLSGVVPVLVLGSIGALLTCSREAAVGVVGNVLLLVVAIIQNISFIAFVSLCCGTVADVLVSYVAINITYPICVFVCSELPRMAIPGVPNDFLPSTVYTVFSPFASYFTAVFGTGYNIYIVGSVFVVAVAITGSFILGKSRRAERAQNAFAYGVMENVIKFITSFTAGLTLGLIMTYVGDNIDYMSYNGYEGHVIRVGLGWFIAGFCIGDIVAHGLFHLIFNRGFRNFKSSLKQCFAVFATGMLYLFIVTTGMFGYDSRVPEISDVKAVCIDYGYYEEEQTFIVDGKNLLEIYHNDEEIISLAVDLHQQFADNIESLTGGTYPIIGFYGASTSNLEINSVSIKYKLKNGRTMTRHYVLKYGDIFFYEKLKKISGENEASLANIPVKYVGAMSLDEINKYGESVDGYWINSDEAVFREEDINKIIDALKKDYEVREKKKSYEIDGETMYSLSFEYLLEKPSGLGNQHAYITHDITTNDVNTLAALKETGYINIDFYQYCLNPYKYEIPEKYGYKQYGEKIYFKVPEDWRKHLDVHCVPYVSEDDEYLISLTNEMTRCREVSEGIYEYVLPQSEKVKDPIEGIMFYQFSDTEMYTTDFQVLGKEGQNLLYEKQKSSGDFVWAKYVEK